MARPITAIATFDITADPVHTARSPGASIIGTPAGVVARRVSSFGCTSHPTTPATMPTTNATSMGASTDGASCASAMPRCAPTDHVISTAPNTESQSAIAPMKRYVKPRSPRRSPARQSRPIAMGSTPLSTSVITGKVHAGPYPSGPPDRPQCTAAGSGNVGNHTSCSTTATIVSTSGTTIATSEKLRIARRSGCEGVAGDAVIASSP